MKRKTYHDGAQEERKALRRKLRAMLRDKHSHLAYHLAKQLLDWVLERSKRYRKRKGGL